MFGFFIRILPKKILSHFVGILVHLPLPRFLAIISMKLFAGKFNINMDEAEKPINDYKSIGDLFIRKLKDGIRPIGDGVVHPADSHITFRGEIQEDQVIYAKDMGFSLKKFIQQEHLDEDLIGGTYFTYYLCPTDYHRVHAPVEGYIKSLKIVPGHLWPVNNWSTDNIDGLFAVNERAILHIKTVDQKDVYFVLVGATNVGQMEFCFDKKIRVDHFKKDNTNLVYDPPIPIKKGEDLGAFLMGSTVVMLYPKDFIKSYPKGSEPLSVHMGGSLCENLKIIPR
jgi:phosphatidylserine decarboxylase